MGQRWFNLIFVRFNSLALFFILFFSFVFVVLYFYTVCTARYSNGISNIGCSRVVPGFFCFFWSKMVWSSFCLFGFNCVSCWNRMFWIYFYFFTMGFAVLEHVGMPCLFYVLVLWMVVCLGFGSAMVCSSFLNWFNCLTL